MVRRKGIRLGLRRPSQITRAPGLAGDGLQTMRKPGKAEKWEARSERLSAALRENLKRRKAQARAHTAGTVQDDAATTADNESEAPDFRRNRSSE
jgi:hypothetical protein